MLQRKKYCLLLFLLTFMFMSLFAQKKDYYTGYIVTLDGDTLEGWIKDRSSGSFTELHPRIRFKSGNSLFRKKFGPDQILGYSCKNQVYESRPLYEESSFFSFRYYLNNSYKPVFLRVMARDEPLTYYHWEYVDDDSGYLDYIPLFHLDGSDQMVRVTQGILGLKRKRLIEYFRDCYKLGIAIYNKELNGIEEVYDFYLNQCVHP